MKGIRSCFDKGILFSQKLDSKLSYLFQKLAKLIWDFSYIFILASLIVATTFGIGFIKVYQENKM